jgi:hypothetical protein
MRVFTGGCDGVAKCWTLQTGQAVDIGKVIPHLIFFVRATSTERLSSSHLPYRFFSWPFNPSTMPL